MHPAVHIIFEKRPGSNNAESWWFESACGAGFDPEIYYADALRGVPPSRHCDVVLMRCYDFVLSEAYEARGIPVFNDTVSMRLCRDKLSTYHTLDCIGIPQPATLPTSLSTAELQHRLGSPFIIKPVTGSKGDGVRLADASTVIPTYGFIAQQYISCSRGRDIRVWTVDGKAVAAVVRTNPGKLVSNFAAGGSATLFDSQDKNYVYDLAERAASACGLFFAGVDILFGNGGSYFLCEVNGNAGFRTLSHCHGTDLPKTVMQTLYDKLYHRA